MFQRSVGSRLPFAFCQLPTDTWRLTARIFAIVIPSCFAFFSLRADLCLLSLSHLRTFYLLPATAA